MTDEELIRKAEQALAEIDRTQGLSDEQADVLATLRIRIYGGPKKTLDDVIKAAGNLRGKRNLEDLTEPPKKSSLEDAFKQPPKKKEWPGL